MPNKSYIIEIITRKRPGCAPQVSYCLHILDYTIEISSYEELLFLRKIINEAINDSVPETLKKDLPYLTTEWFKQERARLQYLERFEHIPVLNKLEKLIKDQQRSSRA